MQINSAMPLSATQHVSVVWTEFPDLSGAKKTEHSGLWSDLVSKLRFPLEYLTKEAMPLMSGARFGVRRTPKGSLRNNDNVQSVHMLVGDYDAGHVTIEDAAERLRNAGVLALIFPTASHTPEGPRWRVLAPLLQACDREAFPACMALLNGALGGILAGESGTLSQSFYVGRVMGKPWHLTVIDGPGIKPIDTDEGRLFIDPIPVKTSKKAAGGSDVGDNVCDVSAWVTCDPAPLRETIRTAANGVHPALCSLSMYLASHGCSRDEIEEELSNLVAEGDDGSPRMSARLREVPGLARSAIDKAVVLCAPPTAEGLPEVEHEGEQVRGVIAQLRAMPHEERLLKWPVMVLSITRPDLQAAALDDLVKLLGINKQALKQTLKQEVERRTKLAGADEARPTHHTYAKQFLTTIEEVRGHYPVGYASRMYAPDEHGIFKGREVDLLATDVAELFDGLEACTRLPDYTAIAKHAYNLCRQDEFFDDAPIGLAAGESFFYVVAGAGLCEVPLAPAHRQRFRHAAVPQEMPTPNFDKLLADTFEGDSRAEQTEFIQEVFGGVALGLLPRYEKAVLLYGPGRSGKGSLTKIMEHLVPPGTKSATSPSNWDQEYYLAALSGVRLNLVGELSDDKPIPAAEFKAVTGRDLLTGRDPAGKPFSFRCAAAQVFSSNYFPPTRDQSEAFFARWLIVGCLNSRIGLSQDTDLAQRIVEEELPGVMYWALKGAERLFARGGFAVTSVHKKLMGQWRQRADSVQDFLLDEDVCRLDPTTSVRRKELYAAYRDWSRAGGRKALALTNFNERLLSPVMIRMGLTVKRESIRREVVFGVALSDPRAGIF